MVYLGCVHLMANKDSVASLVDTPATIGCCMTSFPAAFIGALINAASPIMRIDYIEAEWMHAPQGWSSNDARRGSGLVGIDQASSPTWGPPPHDLEGICSGERRPETIKPLCGRGSRPFVSMPTCRCQGPFDLAARTARCIWPGGLCAGQVSEGQPVRGLANSSVKPQAQPTEPICRTRSSIFRQPVHHQRHLIYPLLKAVCVRVDLVFSCAVL